MESLRIALLSSHHPAERSMGLSHIVSWVAHYLARWGNEVTVYYPATGKGRPPSPSLWEGVRAVGTPADRFPWLPFGAELEFSRRVSRALPPGLHVVMAHNELGGRFAMRRRGAGAPGAGQPLRVAAFHGLSLRFLEMGRARRPPGLRSRLGFQADRSTLRWFEGGGARLADLCVACSHGVAADLVRAYGVAPRRLRVVLNGVDRAPAVLPPEREEARRSFGVPPGTFVLSLLARDPWRKGLDIARKTVHHLREQGVPALLLNAGNEEPPSDGVLGLGVVPEERKRALLAAADVFYLPTRYEGFPAVVQEAAALGLPVVTTPEANLEGGVPGVDYLIVNEEDPIGHAAALRGLYEDPARRDVLALRGRAVLGARTFEAQARQYLELFRTGLDHAGKAPLDRSA